MNDAALYAFAPDPARAGFIDKRVREHLATSLQHIFDCVSGLIRFDRPAADLLLRAVRDQPAAPALFALYTDFVVAAFDERRAEAEQLLTEMLRSRPATWTDMRILTLDDTDLGPGQSARYRRLVNDEGTPFALEPVDNAERSRFGSLLNETFALLQQAAPELLSEVRGLVRDLVLIDSRAEPGDLSALVFDGASTFYLWGALFINAARQTDRVTLAVALAHESAHSHLLGITLGAPLVTNDPSETYESPLRYDPRPMDGLVHATYVLARMVYCLQRVIASGCLSAADADKAATALSRSRRDYQAGLATVAKHARFTPEGAGLFEQARRYMADAA